MSPPHRPRKRLRAPVALAAIIGGHTRRWKIVALHRAEVIRRKWVEAAGEYIARHIVPARLSRRTLRLVAEDTTWLSEMTYLSGPILERLRALLPGDWVDEIRTVIGEPMPPLPEPEPDLELTAPTPAIIEHARQLGGTVADPALRQSIERATVARLRRLDAEGRRELQDRRSTKKTNGESP